jgi:hypothetical protein
MIMMDWLLLVALLFGGKPHDAATTQAIPVLADPQYQTAGKRTSATERRVAFQHLHQEPNKVFVRVAGEVHNLGPRLGKLTLRLVPIDDAGKPLLRTSRSCTGLVAGGVWKFSYSLGRSPDHVAKVLVYVEDRQGPIPCVASD